MLMPKLKAKGKPGPKKGFKLKNEVNTMDHIDNQLPNMHNENKEQGIAPETENVSSDIASVKVTSTETPKKPSKFSDVLKPLKNEAKEQRLRELTNDVAHLEPTRSKESRAIFWEGKDVRIQEVQDNCPYRFSWKPKGSDWKTNNIIGGNRVVSKDKFTIDGFRLVTVGVDSTPDLDVITCNEAILCYMDNEKWLKHRETNAIKMNRRTSDMLKADKQRLEQSASQLASHDIEGAMKTISTRDLLKRAEAGDTNAVLESQNDDFPSQIVRI